MRVHRAIAIAACTAAAVLWSQLALARLTTVHHRTFDLAEYARLAWGLIHGQPWDAIVGGNVLGGHMPWVLAPLGALGALVSWVLGDGLGTAKTLLVAQAFALAFSGYPIFRLAARALGGGAAVWVLLAYLAYPTLGHVATYEMHPGSLALLPLALALDALDAREARRFALACAAALACRASLGLELSMLGALALLAARDDEREHVARAALSRGTRAASVSFNHVAALRKAGLAVAVGGVLYVALSMFVLQPRFGAHPTGGGSLDLHFGPWGSSPFGFVAALLGRPLDVLAHLGSPARLNYLPMVLAPLAFLPLLAPRALLPALPALALNLISVFPTTTRIDSHYLTSAVPALAVAAVYGLRALYDLAARRVRALRGGRRPFRPLAFAWLAVSALANATAGGMPWSLDFTPGDFVADARTHAARAVLAQIPAHASVQAPDPLLPHLAERARVHRGPPPDRGTRYAVLDLSHRARYARREDLLRTQEEPLVRAWLARPDHAVLDHRAPYALVGRGNPRAGLTRRYFIARERIGPASTDVRLTRCLWLRSAWLEANEGADRAERPAALLLTLRADGPCPSDLALRLSVPLSRPLGDAPAPRVDLLCDGLLSPAHFRAGDLVRSRHPLSPTELQDIDRYGLWLGLLRSSGARPEPHDPRSVRVAVAQRP